MSDIIRLPNVRLAEASDIPALLKNIRPAWQAKDLIARVRRLVAVDPSSACQRLFNAAIHDLREKILIAGIDIAGDAAKQYRLPPIEKPEDIENYPTSKLIDLTHRIGLLSRADWRRLCRCYEIRRDLEHEDNEYEAGIEDCVYVFQTCIGSVLSKDPVQPIRVSDVKGLIEQPKPALPAPSLLEDFRDAPVARQVEILKFLVSIAADEKQPDLVRQNGFAFLSPLSNMISDRVKLEIATFLQERIPRSGPTRVVFRIAYASNVLPYLKEAHRRDFYAMELKSMEQTGHRWSKHKEHGDLLRSLKDVGGLLYCPRPTRTNILKWLVLAYLGEKGGMTSFGHVREVFYSDTAEPLIVELVTEAAQIVRDELRSLGEDRDVKRARNTKHIERRWEALLDLVQDWGSSSKAE